LITLALNPVYWNSPPKAIVAAVKERKSLLSRQVIDTGLQAPSQILNTLSDRTIILLAQLYLIPPSTSEIGNYDKDLASEMYAYNQNPIHSLFRNYFGGGILLSGTIIGLGLGAGLISHRGGNKKFNKTLFLAFLYTVFQVIVLIAFIPLPWQRYSIPLIPLICFWAALGFNWVYQTSCLLIAHRRVRSQLTKIFS
jgi:hypothetical protein